MKQNKIAAILIAGMLAFTMTGTAEAASLITPIHAEEIKTGTLKAEEKKQGLINIVAYDIKDIDNLPAHPFPIGGNWVSGEINTPYDLSGGKIREHSVGNLGSLKAGQVFTDDFHQKWKFEFATINGQFSTEPVEPKGQFPDGNPHKYNFFYSRVLREEVYYRLGSEDIKPKLEKTNETEVEWQAKVEDKEIDGYKWIETKNQEYPTEQYPNTYLKRTFY